VPFTPLPFKAAYLIWLGLAAAALLVCWHLVAPGQGLAKLVHLALALALVPVAYEIQLVQPAVFIAAACAVSYTLLRRDRQLLAGAVLAVLVLKPQVALLVPFALLLAGHRRAFIGWVAACVPIGLAILGSLGVEGVRHYLGLIAYAGQVTYNHQLVIAYTLAPWVPALLIEGSLAGLALFAAWRGRDRLEVVYAAGLLGSVLASPYLHMGDLVVLLVAAWFFMRAEPGPLPRLWLAFGALAAEVTVLAIAVPLFLFELGFLALLLWPLNLAKPVAWSPAALRQRA
jgi:hypothetical protein